MLQRDGGSSVLAQCLRRSALIDGGSLLLLAAAIRFLWLGHPPLWSDEIFSLHWALFPPGFIAGRGAAIETNPPAWFLFLHGWIPAFGTSPFALRAPSALCSALTVTVTYALGRVLLSRQAALAGGLFLSIDSFSIYFGQQARAYAALGLCETIALLGLAIALRAPPGGRRAYGAAALFSTASIAAVHLHYTAMFFIAACFATSLLWLLVTGTLTMWRALPWFVSGLVICVTLAPSLANALSLSHSANIAWITPLRPRDLAVFIKEIVAYPDVGQRYLPIGGAGAVLAVVIGIGQRRTGLATALLTGLPVVFCGLLLLVSLWRPLLSARIAVWLAVPICLLLGRGVMAIRPGALRAGALALVVASLGALTATYFIQPPNEDWPAAARFVQDNPACQGPLISYGPYNLEMTSTIPALAGRALYWVRAFSGMAESAEAVLNTAQTHSRAIGATDVPGIAAANPGTVLVARRMFHDSAAAAIGDHVTVETAIPGGITVFCR